MKGKRSLKRQSKQRVQRVGKHTGFGQYEGSGLVYRVGKRKGGR